MTDELYKMPEISQNSQEWLNSLLPEFSTEGAVKNMLEGQFGVDMGGVVNRILNLIFGELRLSLRVLALLLSMGIFLGIINNLQSAFGNKSTAVAARLGAAAYLTSIAIGVFETAKTFALSAMGDLTAIMNGILPYTLSLMMSGNMAISGGAIHPLIYLMCSIMTAAVKNVVLPLSMVSMVLYILSSFGTSVSIGPLADFMQRVGGYIMGFIMVLFTGILSITKFASASFDSLAARGIKFAVSAAVPVVGGSIADAMNSVAGGSILLKNSIGAAGAIMIIAVALLPVIKIGALSLIFRVGGALMGTMGEERVANAVYKMAGCMEMLVAAVASTAVMMVIGVAALMGG